MQHSKPLTGRVRGNSIEFEQPLNLPDGVRVEILVKSGALSDELKRERLQALFGSCARDADDLDVFLRWNSEQRKLSRPELGS